LVDGALFGSLGEVSVELVEHSILIAIWRVGTNGCIYDDPGANTEDNRYVWRAGPLGGPQP
jgi:hypothetical protein